MNATNWAGSCACYIISGLYGDANPKDSMRAFCRIALRSGGDFGSAKFSIVAANYVFTAGPEAKPTKAHPYANYATSFANFIKVNKLGVVRTPGKVLNKKHHPKTTCQTWVWKPDQKALEAWWEANERD